MVGAWHEKRNPPSAQPFSTPTYLVKHASAAVDEAVGGLGADAHGVGDATHALDHALVQEADRRQLLERRKLHKDAAAALGRRAARFDAQLHPVLQVERRLEQGQRYGAEDVYAGVGAAVGDAAQAAGHGHPGEQGQDGQRLQKVADAARRAAVVLQPLAAVNEAGLVPQTRTCAVILF